MFSYTKSAALTIAGAVLTGAIFLAGPVAIAAGDSAGAASADQPGPARIEQTATSPETTAPAISSVKSEAVEARIKELHNRLHITAAQQNQWDNLVQVMRDNAKTMYDLEQQRKEEAGSMTAVDAVKSYQEVIEAHEAGMAKFIPAFQALYDSMSPAQKKTADAMFRGRVRSATEKKAG